MRLPGDRPSLDPPGGGGDDRGMERRVTRLEVQFEYVRRDLDEIKALLVRQFAAIDGKFERLERRIDHLPTKTNLWTMIGTVGGISLAIISIFVAILTYLAPLLARAT